MWDHVYLYLCISEISFEPLEHILKISFEPLEHILKISFELLEHILKIFSKSQRVCFVVPLIAARILLLPLQ